MSRITAEKVVISLGSVSSAGSPVPPSAAPQISLTLKLLIQFWIFCLKQSSDFDLSCEEKILQKGEIKKVNE